MEIHGTDSLQMETDTNLCLVAGSGHKSMKEELWLQVPLLRVNGMCEPTSK